MCIEILQLTKELKITRGIHTTPFVRAALLISANTWSEMIKVCGRVRE